MSDHAHAESAPAEAAKPAAESHAPAKNAGDQLKSMRDSIDAKRAEIGGKIDNATGKVHGFLRFGEVGPATKHNIFIEPVYIAGDILDATAGTAARRIWEVTETTGAMIRATLKIATGPILHPIDTIKHPLRYSANFGRIFTTSLENYANIFNAIPRSIEEVYSRGISRPIERTLGRIPKIGNTIMKLTNGLGWALKQPRRFTEWTTKPIYELDEWMKGQQG
ncbi:MAG: hypothetical protein Q8P62_03200 [Candidatus Peregrinibacteria bacterium]|nr:hypothetical protein [Candidatus Peregrinibacteria bacterium]